jgi:hypothetical protein
MPNFWSTFSQVKDINVLLLTKHGVWAIFTKHRMCFVLPNACKVGMYIHMYVGI